ncbi:hypothetical protein K458DRAFT_405128 [Lentithecium fluviatile CBS 122367]|uniref:Uncharacterized protein n=1 Tax=Lentithecium fluviatile CBS 122367 TaxID=1168545 RepID=A0A6G1IYE3_9PLEO|nr:hypothetical protein K458DRAFT_405128 [Lentithecium fluviatile CBS 122367]
MPHNISYSLFPKDVEHDMPDLAKLQRPGSSRSIDQNCANTQPASYATVAPLKWTKAQPSSSANGASFPSLPEPFPMKMTSSEHKRAHSDPAGPPHPSRHFTLSRLRRTISAPINEKPRIVHVKRCGAKEKERKNTTHEPSRPLNPVNKAEGHIKAINNLQAPPPARSHSTDIKTSSRNFIRASPSIASQDSLNAPLPPLPPPPSPPFVPRPLSTLEEEAPEPVELPATPVLPVIQLNDCKPWIPAAIESPTRAHAAAPPPLKLRPPIKEGAAAPPPALTLSIPPKEQRPVTAPEPAPTPVSPPTSRPPPRPRNKKHVRFVPTSPEIITDATIQAARRDRVQPTRKSSMQKNRNSWSTVFLLSAPSTATDTNSRPSTSPGLKSAQPTGQKSILRRSNSFQNIRPDDAANDADADDDDIEIKPLESHLAPSSLPSLPTPTPLRAEIPKTRRDKSSAVPAVVLVVARRVPRFLALFVD